MGVGWGGRGFGGVWWWMLSRAGGRIEVEVVGWMAYDILVGDGGESLGESEATSFRLVLIKTTESVSLHLPNQEAFTFQINIMILANNAKIVPVRYFGYYAYGRK